MARYNNSSIEQRAAKAKKQKAFKKILLVTIPILMVIIVLGYVVSLMYTRFGSFTIMVNKYDQLEYGLSLSETSDFSKPTATLNCRASEEITNIDGATLDDVDLGAIDGEDNGENYICYTFYCKNSGKKTVTFEQSILITNMTLDIEKAIRVRVIQKYNDEEATTVDYARAAGVEDGVAVPEVGTTMFYSKNIVMLEEISNFDPDDVMKYTIVMWLEGPDLDCVDNIIGGEFKIDMKFTVKGTSTED